MVKENTKLNKDRNERFKKENPQKTMLISIPECKGERGRKKQTFFE